MGMSHLPLSLSLGPLPQLRTLILRQDKLIIFCDSCKLNIAEPGKLEAEKSGSLFFVYVRALLSL